MAYVVRTKDNPGDVGRAADQQQSVDNEAALYAAILGPGPVAAGGMQRQFVKQTGLADTVATVVCTITTTNEAGDNDGGVWYLRLTGMATHGDGPTLETSCLGGEWWVVRGLRGTGTAGNCSAVAVSGPSGIGASAVATKTITSITVTAVETSEYAVEIRFAIDLAGTTVTTGGVFCMAELYYAGFTTPPVITSAG